MLREIWKEMQKQLQQHLTVLVILLLLLQLIALNLVLGNSETASKLAESRNIKLQGAVTGNADFDGSENIIINTTQSNIIVLTGTLKNGQATITSLPAGFTAMNSIIISIMTQNPSKSNQWAIGTTFDSGSYVSGAVPIRAHIQENGIFIQAQNIQLSHEGSVHVSDGPDFNYKIALMKVS